MIIKLISENTKINIDNSKQFLMLVLIFISSSPLFDVFEKLFLTLSISIFLVIAEPTKAIFRKEKINLLVIFILFFFVVVYSFFLDIVRSNDFSYQGFGFFLFLWSAFVISQKITRNDFFQANEALIAITLFAGLPIYLIIQLLPSVLHYGFNYKYGDFYNITFIVVNFLLVDGDSIERFVGFGSEPGLTQVFYLLALFSRFSKNDGKFDFFILIIFIAIFMSKSTYGIAMAILVFTFFSKIKTLVKYLYITLPFIYLFLIDEINYHVTEKLVGSAAFSGRYDRYVYFFENKITDILTGYGNLYYTNNISSADIGGWDSFLQVTQRMGLLFVLILFIFLWIHNKKNNFPIFIIILGAFFTQSIWFSPVIAYFYFKNNNKKYLT